MLCVLVIYRVLVLGGSGGIGTFAVQVCVGSGILVLKNLKFLSAKSN